MNQEGKKEPTDMSAVSVFLCPNSYPGGYPEYEVYGGITQGPVAGNQFIIATLSIPRSNIMYLTDAGLYFQYMTDNMSGVEFSKSDFQFGYEMESETSGLVDMMNTQFAFGDKDDLVDIYPSELGDAKVLEFHMDFRGNGLQEGLDNSDTGRVNIIIQKVIGSTNYQIQIIMSYFG